jgi:hypothetical protein
MEAIVFIGAGIAGIATGIAVLLIKDLGWRQLQQQFRRNNHNHKRRNATL